jgi:hypothetical protein
LKDNIAFLARKFDPLRSMKIINHVDEIIYGKYNVKSKWVLLLNFVSIQSI